MIGKIKGTLIDIDGKEGLIETTGGVSYRVQLMPETLGKLPSSEVDVFTHLQVRDDAHVLFGFELLEQYKMFQTLLTVDGVGPKTAHHVLSQKTVAEIVNAVTTKDVSSFSSVSGLGKKTAQKIILEFSGKLKTSLDIGQIIETPVDTEALEALVALGYRVTDAREMLRTINPSLPTEEKVQQALKRK